MKFSRIISIGILAMALGYFCKTDAVAQQDTTGVVISKEDTIPHASAILDVISTDKGFLLPRMTTAQKVAISSPADGLLVYDSNLKAIYFYDGTATKWKMLADSLWTRSGNDIYFNTGKVALGTTTATEDLTIVDGNGHPTIDLDYVGTNENDPRIRFRLNGSGMFTMGVDQNSTAGNKFTIAEGDDLSTTPLITINNDGHTGIGSTAPAEMLDVAGAVKIGNNINTNAGTIRWTGTDFEGYDGSSWVTLTGSGQGQWEVSGSDIYYNSGKVGVGISAPAHDLQINSGNNPTMAIGKLNANTTNQSTLQFYAGDGGGGNNNAFKVQYNKSSSTDRLSFLDGGAMEGLTIINGGKVGVNGITSPSSNLHVKGSIRTEASANTNHAIFFHDGTNAYLNAQNGQLRLQQGGASRLFIDTDGDVGIGSATPAFKLDVAGAVNATELRIDGNLISESQWTTSGSDIYYSSGNVGIGLSSPSANFDAYENTALGSTSGNSQIQAKIHGSAGSNDFQNNYWLYRDAAGSDWLTGRWHDGISIDGSFQTPGTDTKTWWERDPYNNIQSWGNAASTYLTINAGNIGIGSVSPSYKLDVNGTVNATDLKINGNSIVQSPWTDLDGIIHYNSGVVGIGTSSPGTYKLVLKEAVSNSGYGFRVLNANETKSVQIWVGSGGAVLDAEGTTSLHLRTGGVDRMYFNTSGSVGIGTTAPAEKLEVNGGVKFGNSTGTNSGTIRWSGSDFEGYKDSDWVSLTGTGLPSGTSGKTLRHDGTSWVANDIIYNNGSKVGIGGITSPSTLLHLVNPAYPLGANEGITLEQASTASGHLKMINKSSANAFAPLVEGEATGESSEAGITIRGVPSGDVTGIPSVLIQAKDTDGETATDGAEVLVVKNWDTELFRIDKDGNVGIGTTSPGHTLDVDGDVEIGANNGLLLSDDASVSTIQAQSNSLLLQTTSSSDDLIFKANSSEVMRIDATNGNLGIGTSAPASGYKLDVKGKVQVGSTTANQEIDLYGTLLIERVAGGAYSNTKAKMVISSNIGDPGLRMMITDDGSSYSDAIFIQEDLNIGIGTTDPVARLDVDGTVRAKGDVYPKTNNTYDLGTSTYKWNDVWATNGTIQTSDRRLKTNIQDIPYGLNEVMQLKPVTFYWKDNPEKDKKVGLIAQEVQQVINEVVRVGDDSSQTLGMNYADLVAVLIKAIQEQQQLIEEQKATISNQNKEINMNKATDESLQKQLDTLKAMVDKLGIIKETSQN